MEKIKVHYSVGKLIGISFIGLAIIIFVWWLLAYIQSKNYYYEYELDGPWDAYVDGEQIASGEVLDEINFGVNPRLTKYDLYTVIPEEIGTGYTVEFFACLCSLEAYVDGQKIYDYASDQIALDHMVGSGYHFINLPANCGGKQFWIHMVMNEYNASTGYVIPRVSKTREALTVFAASQAINSVIGITLIGLGFILTIVGIFTSIANPMYTRIIFIGLFSFLMGSWSALNNKIGQIYSLNRTRYSELEYVALYWAPVAFGIIVWLMRKEDKTWRKNFVLGLTMVLALFSFSSMVMHYTNTVRFPQMLSYFHILGGLSLLGLMVAGFLSVTDKSRSEYVTTIAIIILVEVLALDVIRFNIQKYLAPNIVLLLNSLIPIGTIFFITMLLFSYLLYLYDMIMSNAENEMLTNLAYHDILTGLLNRTKFDETIKEIDSSGIDFAIINFDVNGLKSVNDTFGHEEGDNLIKIFAKMLEDEFGTLGSCYRMGGDEFLVVVDDRYFNSIENALRKLKSAQKAVSAGLKYEIDAAYGLAFKSEVAGGTVENVYSQADKRMYEMKIRAHNSRTYQSMNFVPNWKE